MKFQKKYFGKVKFNYDVPYLLDLQKKSYESFLQMDVKHEKRENKGLAKLFRSFFPVRVGEVEFDVVSYSIEKPFHTPNDCIKRNLTYSAPVRVTFRISNSRTKEVIEKKNVYIGDIPLMTDRATFIINGVERVIVSQIIKSSGIIFSNRKGELSCKIVPEKGMWLEFGISLRKELMYFSIDNKKKMLLTYFLRAIGMNTEDIIKNFFEYEVIDLSKGIPHNVKSFYLYEDVKDDDGNVIFLAGSKVSTSAKSQVQVKENYVIDSETFLKTISTLSNRKIKIISEESIKSTQPFFNTFRRELETIAEYTSDNDVVSYTREEKLLERAIKKIADQVRSISYLSNPTRDNILKEIQRQLYDVRNFDLGEVGRYKLVLRLYKDVPESKKQSLKKSLNLLQEDIVRAIKTLLQIYSSNEIVDDIDHLSNRRIKAVGELVYQQLLPTFAKLQKIVEDKLSADDRGDSAIQSIIMSKPFSSALNEFFGTNQLSHFMDQINPLSELTNKRRVSALGPGGFTRERAGFEVRDIHYSHYGRLCPIETPEGQNIGLILSLATYAKVNEYGFIETPYRVVSDGKVTEEVRYVNPIDEEDYYICQSTEPIDDEGFLANNEVQVRYRGKFLKVPREKVQLMDVSPKQLFSVSTSLIPFLEHDDANRALMGSNMQRQAVPLIKPQAPIVGTTMEEVVAKQVGYGVVAEKSGVVKKVSSTYIVVQNDDGTEKRYDLMKFYSTNNNTCYNQRPIVNKGQKVERGQVIADGPAMDNGELALGTNLLIAYMPWYGYNYEDAITISERLVKEDLLTSIHIYDYEVAVRSTKFGDEEITREIPGVSEDKLLHLDEEGIVRIGSHLKSGDIIVGKITPKSEEVDSPEFKLIKVIFGEKSREVKDSSLRVPHGEGGIVIGVDRFSKKNKDELPIGVKELVKVYIAQKRKIKVGDKLSGRHGNKGVIAKIAPIEDMPMLPDGTPVDIVLNPLGVPSRMNLGQLFETMLGWAGIKLGYQYRIPVFEGPSYEEVKEELRKAGLPETSKVRLRDGRTGEYFESEVMVGYHYIMKLVHMVDDKIHARSIGPYALITQQPLGGKAQFGGQRLGEMEVWALEAYGASTLLHEMLTVKSDDIEGRVKAYDGITKGKYVSQYNIPESFKVLVNEMRGLLLDLEVFDRDGNYVYIFPKDRHVHATKNKRS
ncbi:MAG: DNA-directed RNA polymerase subunit beta [Spirochaetia bacterium]|nr:DNA-directed RNA polymerase subunit beta [Spirochaetota bacterium]MCX8096363.1 DNA-directed RNA polymerase subunit beta [Spirochaetota bacterium]MDW8113053.1 DNA-directed RNA polymerase subunit beta [Spirochaetia bacterium]